MKWWEAPQYDKGQDMKFPDLRSGPMRRIATSVEYRDGRWASTPIRVYVGPSYR